MKTAPNTDAVMTELVAFIRTEYLHGESSEIPLDRSLLEEGILDSFAIVELATFMEKSYGILIGADEINSENFGSLMRMAQFVSIKKDLR